MSIGKRVAEAMNENGVPSEGEPDGVLDEVRAPVLRASIALPPKAREELKALLRMQNEAQERIRLVLTTLEEALEVPVGWAIRDIETGFEELQAEV